MTFDWFEALEDREPFLIFEFLIHMLLQLTIITINPNEHQQEKKHNYFHCIKDNEHSLFSPIVFSSVGGMTKEATIFYKLLTSLLSEKWDQPYCITMEWLHCTITPVIDSVPS